jgi:pyruvate ferredoxin oxidoreductase gamma subunit
MFAYVRAGHGPIHERGAIERPDLVVVADATLIPVPAANILFGVTPRTVLLVNSPTPATEWRQRLAVKGPVVSLPLGASLEDRADLPYVGAMCVGAAARILDCVTRESLASGVRDELVDQPAEVVARNIERSLGAYDLARAYAGLVRENDEPAVDPAHKPRWVELPVDYTSVSAPEIRASATSVQTKTGAWRTARPVVDFARCNRCTWVCSTMCPDSAIQVTADHRPEIDYDHCKGCLICVAVCPQHAIAVVPESEFNRAAR